MVVYHYASGVYCPLNVGTPAPSCVASAYLIFRHMAYTFGSVAAVFREGRLIPVQ